LQPATTKDANMHTNKKRTVFIEAPRGEVDGEWRGMLSARLREAKPRPVAGISLERAG
jgi:hypothetical protein